jgi:hypothetical protein
MIVRPCLCPLLLLLLLLDLRHPRLGLHHLHLLSHHQTSPPVAHLQALLLLT